MGQALRYEAGFGVRQPHAFRLDLNRAGLDETRADCVTRFIEFWCQANCVGAWRVEETERAVRVSFALPHDVVLFKISAEAAEYDYITE